MLVVWLLFLSCPITLSKPQIIHNTHLNTNCLLEHVIKKSLSMKKAKRIFVYVQTVCEFAKCASPLEIAPKMYAHKILNLQAHNREYHKQI